MNSINPEEILIDSNNIRQRFKAKETITRGPVKHYEVTVTVREVSEEDE